MADTRVNVVENNEGVEATWFAADNSAAGAQYGLIGALVTATMDGMINSGPSGQAQKIADEIATVGSVDRINTSFSDQLKQAAVTESYKVRFSDVSSRQPLVAPKAQDDAVEVSVTYFLSEDATVLRMVANASYARADAKYVTPYTFKSVPSDELEGPLYRNTFIYESKALSLPTLTPELKASWVADINQRWSEKNGLPPARKERGYAQYQDELKEANNDTITKAEASSVLVKQWIANGGEILFNEIKNGHAYFAKYILADLNTADVPRLDGSDRVVEQLADGRIVRLIGAGETAGTYISTPGNISAVTTYGNAAETAKVNIDRMNAIRDNAKKQAK